MACEDAALRQALSASPFTNWPTVALSVQGRTAKQCRERWHSHLSPHVNRSAFTGEEDVRIMNLHELWGDKWAQIAATVPGRSAHMVKSRIKALNPTVQKRVRRNSAPAGSLRALIHADLNGSTVTPAPARASSTARDTCTLECEQSCSSDLSSEFRSTSAGRVAQGSPDVHLELLWLDLSVLCGNSGESSDDNTVSSADSASAQPWSDCHLMLNEHGDSQALV